jgi:hypothetical protein
MPLKHSQALPLADKSPLDAGWTCFPWPTGA